jgi:hypothetical protein
MTILQAIWLRSGIHSVQLSLIFETFFKRMDIFPVSNKPPISYFLLSLARKYKDICIEPVAFTTADLYGDNPFVKEICSTGKEIEFQ